MPPTPSPGNGTPEIITGSERIGWDQPASGAAEIASFRYAIYVDGNRLVLGQSSCASAAGAAGFPCSAALPPLSPGTHVLELTAFIEAETFESARSTPLRVTVTGSTTAAEAAPSLAGCPAGRAAAGHCRARSRRASPLPPRQLHSRAQPAGS